MTAFADSSALVKLYAQEPGTEAVEREPALVVCALARVEVPSALWRKHRIGELDAEDAAVLVAAFEADYDGTPDDPPRFAALPVTADLLDAAAALPAAHDLGALDAIQLAAALAVAEVQPEAREFLCFDRRLRAAAAARGLRPRP